MAKFQCSAGHEWDAAEASAAPLVCPRCGRPPSGGLRAPADDEKTIDADVDQTLDLPTPGGATPAPSAPVETERLGDLTDDEPERLRDLVTLYLTQTSTQIVQLEALVQSGNAPEIRRLAHSCAGASATCGVRRLVVLLRQLEQKGAEARLEGAPELYREIVAEFDCVRHFLEAYLAAHSGLASQSQP